MGMMDMAQMPQQQPAPPQGMMGGQQGSDPSLSHGQFNGTVTVEGKPVEVKAGVAMVEGKPFMVSDNGAMVVDHEGNLVGHVDNGTFVVADQGYLDQMKQKGYVQ